MRTFRLPSALPAFGLLFLANTVFSQSVSNPSCSLQQPVFAATAPNIFDDRQEQDLGDALAEFFEADMRIAPPAPDDKLTKIGEKLVATLPPTGIHYRFRIYDSGEVNGFSVAGGRVYISRKLIVTIKNEDELAGVLAHELGHLSTHQTAIEMTYLLKVRLGITKVGDRADIFAKVHQLLIAPAKDNEAEEKEEKDQLVADRVALYAMVRAGYAPESFASYLNQSMENKGKTGNWLTDVFGLTREESRRYREALKLISELPPDCRGKQPSASEAFLAWQKRIVEERVQLVAQGDTGDQPLKLQGPLRPSPWRIRFSPDGQYVLMQDEGNITVADAQRQKFLFRIDAPDVHAAKFTPDSKNIVFNDDNLRVEMWDVGTGQRTSVKELVVYDGCSQSLLSADGRTLACVKVDLEHEPPRIGLRLFDVASGSVIYDKPTFFELNALASFASLWSFYVDALAGIDMVTMLDSPDGRYLLVSVGNDSLAYDFQLRQQVALGGKLKGLSQSRMSFVGSDRFYVVDREAEKGLFPAKVLSFPDGRLLGDSKIGDQTLESTTRGPNLVVSPLKDYAVAVFDPTAGKILVGWPFPGIDVWDDQVATENATGSLLLSRIGSHVSSQISLPLGPLPSVRAAAFSPDGRYLVVSLRNRSQEWDLTTGTEVRIIRPIQSLWIDDNDRLIGQFPKYVSKDAADLEFSLASGEAKPLGAFEDKDGQFRNLKYSYKPMGKGNGSNQHVTLEIKNMETGAVLWSRDYPHERPVCWPADGDRMVLGWDLSSDSAKSELKGSVRLQDEAASLKNHKKGLLIETVVAETGAPLQQVVLPEVDLTKGFNDERFARISGDYVLVRGEADNTVIYRLNTGEKVGEFFGSTVASDSGLGLIAAVNREDEILLVDETTGKELRRFNLGSPVRLARIITKDKMLLVLTADQTVHRISVAKDATPVPPQSTLPLHPAS